MLTCVFVWVMNEIAIIHKVYKYMLYLNEKKFYNYEMN